MFQAEGQVSLKAGAGEWRSRDLREGSGPVGCGSKQGDEGGLSTAGTARARLHLV